MSDEIIVTGKAPSFPNTYNYSSMMGYDKVPTPTNKGRLGIAFANGTATAKFLQQCLDNIDEKPSLIETILCKGAFIEQQHVIKPGAYLNFYYSAPSNFSPSSQTELSKDSFSPIAALFHYAYGDGSPMYTDLSKLSFNLSEDKIPAIKNIIDAGRVGVFNINTPIGYDFRDSSYWEWSYLGRVSLTLEGTLKIEKSGNWSFNGQVGGLKDRYDANKDVTRGKVGELLTDLLRKIDGKEYDIMFKGKHDVSMKGKK